MNAEEKTTFLYALLSPADEPEISAPDPSYPEDFAHRCRYIGKANDPHERYHHGHLRPTERDRQTHKGKWIARLREEGRLPVLVILEECRIGEWQERERWWELFFRQMGAPLTNLAECGQGPPVTPITEEYRAKLRAGHEARMSLPGYPVSIARRDYTGQRFGRLVALEKTVIKGKEARPGWLCLKNEIFKTNHQKYHASAQIHIINTH